MNAATLLADLCRRGVRLSVSGERLSIDAPRGTVTADLRAALIEHKADLIRLLDPLDEQVAWRVEEMRRQVRPGPHIPFLVARRDFADAPGLCMSCGDLCGSGRRYRCGPCVHAAEIVVNEAW